MQHARRPTTSVRRNHGGHRFNTASPEVPEKILSGRFRIGCWSVFGFGREALRRRLWGVRNGCKQRRRAQRFVGCCGQAETAWRSLSVAGSEPPPRTRNRPISDLLVHKWTVSGCGALQRRRIDVPMRNSGDESYGLTHAHPGDLGNRFIDCDRGSELRRGVKKLGARSATGAES